MKKTLQLTLHASVLEISPTNWNSLLREEDPPFLEWEWFAALESSKSICPQTGWQPCHLCLWDANRLVGVAPLYIKSHSGGEFVFDYFWAEAAKMLGRSYYPKLVGVIPATPTLGYRFLSAEGYDLYEIFSLLLEASQSLGRTYGLSGIHLLFAEPRFGDFLSTKGYSAWKHHHYLWQNNNFKDFRDYLAQFSKNQRKNIRKEREEVAKDGVHLQVIPATEGKASLFKHMFRLYTRTNEKFVPYDARYVNASFFEKIQKTFSHRIYFAQATEASNPYTPLALAMLARKGKFVWGRYWGTYKDLKDLHFEVCYYTPIQWAINEGILTFDPGAGSPHKIRRGFLAQPHYSYHHFLDPLLEQVFRVNIGQVNQMEEQTVEELNKDSPLKILRRNKLHPEG